MKNRLKYMILLLCLLLIGCSGNGKFNSEQEKQQDTNNEDGKIGDNDTLISEADGESTQESVTESQTAEIVGDSTTEDSTIGDITTQDSATGNKVSIDVRSEDETENESSIEDENLTGKSSESIKSTNTELNDEQLVNNSTDNQQTSESGENLETKIVVYKADRRLELWQDDEMTAEYHIGLSKKAEGKKEKEGDKKTPEGEYFVCTKNQYSKFYLALGVSYPNIEDAKSGLENGLIDENTFNSIETAILNGQCPPWNTALGGEIMIHGHGGSEDWTKGCIGVDDEVMDVLWEACSIGTKIVINP